MKQIRAAIIGLGRSGQGIHGQHLLKDMRRFKVVAAVDPIKERREWAAAQFGCATHKDHAPLLRREDVDLVVNASPSHFHVPITQEFLSASFNVLCEKPLASRVADVDRLIAAAKRSRKTLAIFQQSRYAPYFRQVREVIDSGVLGRILQISIAFNGFGRRYDWQTLTEMMGGSLLNTGPHPLDQALQLFGTDTVPEVTCLMRRAVTCGDAEDHVMLILSGEGRPIVDLEISSCCSYPCFTYNIYGTRGGLKGDANDLTWKYFDPNKAPRLRLKRKPLSDPDGTPAWCQDSLEWIERTWKRPDGDWFAGMSADFYGMLYKTLTTGAPLEIAPQQVRQQIAVIEECQRQNPRIYGRSRYRLSPKGA